MASLATIWGLLLLHAVALTVAQTCATITPQNKTTLTGKQLGNVTVDLPVEIAAQTCCSIATSLANSRSKNSTDPVGWTATVLGPAKTHKGQSSINCAAYDYGAVMKPAPSHSTAGLTPPLTPFPPPPPSCSTYKDWDTCPSSRCFWTQHTCASTPPIDCHYECTPGDCPEGPMCVHLQLNTSRFTGMKLIGNAGSFNATVLSKPPASFESDVFFSVKDGLIDQGTQFHQFRFCTQFESDKDANEQVAVCVSLIPGSFDLQVATSEGLTYKGTWMTSGNLVASIVIDNNTTATRNPASFEMLSTKLNVF